MGIKPWEPVTYRWGRVSGIKISDPIVWRWAQTGKDERINEGDAMELTLANGQRIIVRALSEDRKAARAAMKEAPK